MNLDTSRLSKDFGYCTESVIAFTHFVKIMSFNNGNISNKICSNIAFDYARVVYISGDTCLLEANLLTHVVPLVNNFEKNCLKFSSPTVKIIEYQVDI